MCKREAICFGFPSDQLNKCWEFFKLINKCRNAKPIQTRITFDTYVKACLSATKCCHYLLSRSHEINSEQVLDGRKADFFQQPSTAVYYKLVSPIRIRKRISRFSMCNDYAHPFAFGALQFSRHVLNAVREIKNEPRIQKTCVKSFIQNGHKIVLCFNTIHNTDASFV